MYLFSFRADRDWKVETGSVHKSTTAVVVLYTVQFGHNIMFDFSLDIETNWFNWHLSYARMSDINTRPIQLATSIFKLEG